MSRWLRSGISPSLKERRAVLAKNKIRILLKIKKRSPHLKKKNIRREIFYQEIKVFLRFEIGLKNRYAMMPTKMKDD